MRTMIRLIKTRKKTMTEHVIEVTRTFVTEHPLVLQERITILECKLLVAYVFIAFLVVSLALAVLFPLPHR